MRAYTVATAAVTLKIPTKWLDNVLSHHAIPGIARGRQGVSRRLTPQAILSLDVAIRLSDTLSMPIGRALELARQMVQQRGTTPVGKGITVHLNIESLEAELAHRLAQAVEMAPLPKRGRPAGS